MQTFFGASLRQRASAPQAPLAIVMPGHELNFAELHDRVERCAKWLIGITIADELTHLVVSLALLQLGVRTPRRIVVLEALSRNAAGKIVNRDLIGMVEPSR